MFETSTFFSLTNPSPDEERDRSRDVCRSIDEEKGDLDDEIDVELDGNDQLDLDLDSEHNDDDLDLSQTPSLIQRIELALHKNLSGPQLFHNQS